MQSLLDDGVHVGGCSNTLEAFDLAESDLLEGVELVPEGAVEVTRPQDEGDAYLRPSGRPSTASGPRLLRPEHRRHPFLDFEDRRDVAAEGQYWAREEIAWHPHELRPGDVTPILYAIDTIGRAQEAPL